MLGFLKLILKWGLIILGVVITSPIVIAFSPILFFVSLAGVWYFTITKPNEKYEKYAKRAAIYTTLAFVVLVYITYAEGLV